jgi:hypothetical protein
MNYVIPVLRSCSVRGCAGADRAHDTEPQVRGHDGVLRSAVRRDDGSRLSPDGGRGRAVLNAAARHRAPCAQYQAVAGSPRSAVDLDAQRCIDGDAARAARWHPDPVRMNGCTA